MHLGQNPVRVSRRRAHSTYAHWAPAGGTHTLSCSAYQLDDLQIKCASAGDRPASQTNWLKITPEQLQKIERILLGDV